MSRLVLILCMKTTYDSSFNALSRGGPCFVLVIFFIISCVVSLSGLIVLGNGIVIAYDIVHRMIPSYQLISMSFI